MAKKQNKSQAALDVKIEDRYIRGIALEIIAFLTLFFIPKTLAVRLVSILLIAVGMSNKKIARIVDCSVRTVSTLRGLMKHNPVACLLVIKKGSGRKSKVDQSLADQIAEDVRRARYSTLRQIAKMIKKSYEITISESSVMRILRKYNIRKLKSGSLPAKADPEAQRKFYEETLHPLMEKAKNGSATLYFMDASHFIMGSDYTGCFYGDVRKHNKTLSGRQRYNVLGCLDFISMKVITITNATYIRAVQVCRLLVKIYKFHKSMRGENSISKEVHVVLDNARYQKNKMVTKLAEKLNIVLDFVPPYSPNLNLIERFWKYVKGEIPEHTYNDFEEFQNVIDTIISKSDNEAKDQIDSLIGEKVQLYDGIVEISEGLYVLPKKEKKEAS